VIGVIAGITILAAGLFFLFRKRRSTSRTQGAELGPSDRKEELPGDQLVGKYPHQQHQIAEVDSSYRHPVVEADAGYPRQEMS
jgi:LPXTG-motif cell wall-anchored protein